LGRDGFGWHGATMLEQPPLSVYWAVQQRLRWVLGALQGWRAMGQRDDLMSIPAKDRARLRRAVGFRIATYALGFPVGFAGLFFLVHHPAREFAGLFLLFHHPLREVLSIPLTGIWRLAITVAGLGWIFSYQIGLARNLRYQNLSLVGRLRQHLIVLLMTPVTGMFETAGPFLALTRWLAGARQAKWTPTPKTVGRPSAVSPAAAPVLPPGLAAPAAGR
jgi:egghead protein (zeste-white 4 protein)